MVLVNNPTPDGADERAQLRDDIAQLRVDVSTAIAIARHADERADRSARELWWATLGFGLSLGLAILLLVLAVIPGGQL